MEQKRVREAVAGQVGQEKQDEDAGHGTPQSPPPAAVGAGKANDQASDLGSSVAGSAVVREELAPGSGCGWSLWDGPCWLGGGSADEL